MAVPPAPATSTSAPIITPASPGPAGLPPPLLQPRSRWVAAPWSDLPGWNDDRTGEFWPALLKSCQRPAAGWAALCADAQRRPAPDDAGARAWLQQRLQPYRIESLDGQAEGLATGYFEPLLDASRSRRPGFETPLYAPPADLASRRPYWTRREIDTLPAVRASQRVLAWLSDPLDALIVQIQGSGRLRFAAPDPAVDVRVAFAGHNDQPYQSVGRWLIAQGELKPDQASWPAIKAWAQLHPQQVEAMLWSNPRVVFFREEPLPDPSVGPRGAQGVPLTAGRSIAVDPQSVPYGTPVWLATTEPLSATPLLRAVMAQDTGSAIVGAVRADFFWGTGEEALQQAGRMKQPLRLWALWPAGR